MLNWLSSVGDRGKNRRRYPAICMLYKVLDFLP